MDVLEALLQRAKADLRPAPENWRAAAGRLAFDGLVCIAGGLVTRASPMDHLVEGLRAPAGLELTADVAFAASEHDMDDLHWDSVTHPGSIIWPAVLTAAAGTGATVEQVLAAAALGYQMMVRTALLLGPEHRRNFHVTSTAGTLGAVAAVGSVSGLGDEELLTAMRHATSLLSGSGQAMRERSVTGQFHRAHAAVLGRLAVRYAGDGPAVLGGLDGPAGFAPSTGIELLCHSLDFDVAPAVTATTIRHHAVTGFAHTVVDALQDLGTVPLDDIEQVEVTVPSFVVAATEDPTAEFPAPAGWHVPSIVAMTLAGRLPMPGERAVVGDSVAELRHRVQVMQRPAEPPDLRVSVTVTRWDGRQLQVERASPVGHPDTPLCDRGLFEKAAHMGLGDGGSPRRLLDALTTSSATAASLPLDAIAPTRRTPQ